MSKKASKKGEAENIQVAVRVRPLFTSEIKAGEKVAVECLLGDNTVVAHTEGSQQHQWTFDHVFNSDFTQNDIFLQVVHPMIHSVLDGFNATIFAYGQSGSGKSHTMTGKLGDHELEGIIPRTFHHLFAKVQEAPTSSTFQVKCSFLELYNNKCRDLLAPEKVSLAIREEKQNFFVPDLRKEDVAEEQVLFDFMEIGTERREVESTKLNSESSRSHSIFTVHIEQTVTFDDGDTKTIKSKLNLVDLAGSERAGKSQATGQTLKTGAEINSSLMALGHVIDSIVKGLKHIPFRSNPLTMLLKDSLGGGAKTIMFANIRPSNADVSETCATLRFADRAKQIKNKPKVQMDPKDEKIVQLLETIEGLQNRLRRYEPDGEMGPEKEEEGKEDIQELLTKVEGDLQQSNEHCQRLQEKVEQTEARATKIEEEMKLQLETVREELQNVQQESALVDRKLQDERGQNHELLRLIGDFLVDVGRQEALREWCQLAEGEEYSVPWVSSSLDAIRDHLEGGVSQATVDTAVATALSEQRARSTEADRRREAAHTAEVQRLTGLNEQAQSALTQSLQRLEKVKEKIDSEKRKGKARQEEHRKECEVSRQKHTQELQSLKDVIVELEGHLQKEKEEVVDLQRQLAAQRVDTARLEGLEESMRRPRSGRSSAGTSRSSSASRQEAQLQAEYQTIQTQYEEHCEALVSKLDQLQLEQSQLMEQADPSTQQLTDGSVGVEDVVHGQLAAKEAEAEQARRELHQLKGQFGRDKERLLGRIDRMKREGSERVISAGPEKPEEMEKVQIEVEAIRTNNDAVTAERDALRLEFDRAQEAANVSKVEAQRLASELEHVQREFSWLQQNHQETLALVQQHEDRQRDWAEDRKELETEVEQCRNDLVGQTQKVTEVTRESLGYSRQLEEVSAQYNEASDALEDLRCQLAQSEARLVQVQGDVSARHANQVLRLEGKLEEKVKVLQNNQQVLRTQQELLEKKKEKELQLDKRIHELQHHIEVQEETHRLEMAEQGAKLTQASNKRIEQVVMRHHEQLQAEQHEYQLLKQKLTKERRKVAKVKERYDQQTVLCQELESNLEVMKEAEMRRMVGYDEVTAAKDDIDKVLREKGKAKDFTSRQQALLGRTNNNTSDAEPRRDEVETVETYVVPVEKKKKKKKHVVSGPNESDSGEDEKPRRSKRRHHESDA